MCAWAETLDLDGIQAGLTGDIYCFGLRSPDGPDNCCLSKLARAYCQCEDEFSRPPPKHFVNYLKFNLIFYSIFFLGGQSPIKHLGLT